MVTLGLHCCVGMNDMTSTVRIGSRVRMRDRGEDAKFSVVAAKDADAASGRVSAESPLGRALLGRRAGDEVKFRAPGGVLAVTVLEVNG